MPIINILDKKVYNRISAGEVVERPASVVKELVENAVDAGATEISVTIESGGIASIKVTDNGSGLEREQLKKAFLPHATSKIKLAEDLDDIETLGFRGEALASIGAVSHCTFASKTEEQEVGAAIDCDGGDLSDVYDCPTLTGSTVTCKDLFFNTPARGKFLKSAKSEEGEVESLLLKMALSRPEIAFRFVADGKTKIETFGGGLTECISSVYGPKTLENCFEVEQTKNGIEVSGYVGKISFTKPTRAFQTLIVNGRYVTDTTVSAAVANAYGSYLMKRQYPFYVLNLIVPPQTVDVNVHPRKAEVRFSDNQIIYGAVYSTISKVLDGTSAALDIIKNDGAQYSAPTVAKSKFENAAGMNSVAKSDLPFSVNETAKTDNVAPYNVAGVDKFAAGDNIVGVDKFAASDNLSDNKEYKEYKAGGFSTNKNADEKPFADMPEERKTGAAYEKTSGAQRMGSSGAFYVGNGKGGGFSYATADRLSVCDPLFGDERPSENPDDIFAENKRYAEKLAAEKLKAEQQKIEVAPTMIYVGQAFNTYLIFQYADDLYLIDQHAAHERMLYDALCEKAKRGMLDTQVLLLPYVFKTSREDFDKIYSRFRYFREIGIEIDNVGDDTFKVSALPCELCSINLKEFFDDILYDNDFKTEEIPLTLKEKLMQTACKHAIKGGDQLDRSEIDALMAKINGNFGLRCPHGRPVAVKVTKTEIEKWFKRIV